MKKEQKKLIMQITILVVSVAVVCTSMFFLFDFLDKKSYEDLNSDVSDTTSKKEEVVEIINYNGVDYKPNKNLTTWLFLGIDKYEYEREEDFDNSQSLADFILMLVFDNEKKEYKVIQINRDTMATFDTYNPFGEKLNELYAQITLAYTYGEDDKASCKNMTNAVSKLLYETEIDNTLSFTMDAIAIMNDLVGGVEVTITDDFSKIEPAFVMGETITLKGEQAMTYVRTRRGMGDQTNLSRMKRQQEFMTNFEKKLNECSEKDSNFLFNMLNKVSDYMYTDASITKLSKLFDRYSEYEHGENLTIKGETEIVESELDGMDHVEFYPNELELQKLIIDVFYEKAIKE